MNTEIFFNKFDQLADAPDAVPKLRELVLEWAATGKLCHSASAKWKDGTLAEVIELISGQHLMADEHNADGRGIPYLTGPSDFGEKSPVPSRWTEHPKVTAQPGDILITVKGSGVGKTNVLLDVPTAISRQLMAVRVVGAEPEFVHIVLKRASRYFQDAKTGIAIPGIGRREVLDLKLVLPPLAEQKRIVAKVDALMAQCDRLAEQLRERDTRQVELARAALARFAEAPTSANLNLLFHDSFTLTPADLRKTILTLAVKGKLVPQDSKDEPADCILARLADEREKLVAKKLLPKLKELDEPKDAPFDLPESWAWAQLGSISHLIEYGTSHKASDNTTHVPVYRMGDIQGGALSDENLKYVPPHIEDLPKLFLEPGDILFNRTNSAELVGKAAIFKGTSNTHTFASYLIRVRIPAAHIDPEFINLSFLAPYFRESQIEPEIVQQCGQANFNGTKLAHTLFPIPPFAEQRRIVAKVDLLMVLVDEWEARLTATRTTATQLLDALVAELTSTH